MKMRNANVTVMIADPPWPHANGSRTNSGKSPKYQLMNLKEIAALGPVVTKLAGDDAVLYLWATCPHLPGAIATIESWGFRYRSYLVWRKQTVASGYWARSDAEICLIAEKGYPQGPDKSSLPRTIIEGQRVQGRHSSKPDAVHGIVERLWPNARKVELFGRTMRAGWEVYGDEFGHDLNDL